MKFDENFKEEKSDFFNQISEEIINLNVNGGAPGINSHFAIRLPYTVIVLSNFDPPSAMRVGNKIERMLVRLDNSV